MIKIAPSIISADFSCLAKEIKKVESAGADMLHIDVMDGHFVPNITIGPPVVKSIRKVTRLPLDVHLMIEQPKKYAGEFVKAGSDMITFHIETCSASDIKQQASRLKKKNVKVGVSLNPQTPLKKIIGLLDVIDFVLLMTVNPGFSGQSFIPASLAKIKELRAIFKKDISVDGGVNDKVAADIIRAGANILVTGSYIFTAKNKRLAMERIRYAK